MRVTAPKMLAAALVAGAALPAAGLGAGIGLQDDRMAASSAGAIGLPVAAISQVTMNWPKPPKIATPTA